MWGWKSRAGPTGSTRRVQPTDRRRTDWRLDESDRVVLRIHVGHPRWGRKGYSKKPKTTRGRRMGHEAEMRLDKQRRTSPSRLSRLSLPKWWIRRIGYKESFGFDSRVLRGCNYCWLTFHQKRPVVGSHRRLSTAEGSLVTGCSSSVRLAWAKCLFFFFPVKSRGKRNRARPKRPTVSLWETRSFNSRPRSDLLDLGTGLFP